MKLKIFIFVFTILSNCETGKCSCSDGEITIWPNRTEVSKRQLFIIEGFGFFKDIIKSLKANENIILHSSKNQIPIKLKIIEGHFNITQGIIYPLQDLEYGETYKIELLENLKNFQSLINANNNHWKVSNSLNEEPKWKCEPKLFQYLNEYQGYNNNNLAIFCSKIYNKTPTAIHVKLFDIINKKDYEYFISRYSDLIKIGSQTCSGEFRLVENYQYLISFALISNTEKNTESFTRPFLFRSPKKGEIKFIEERTICECNETMKPLKETNNNFRNLIIVVITLVGVLLIGLIKINGSH